MSLRGIVWQFIGGYVKIRLEGLQLERCINAALSRGVVLRDLARPGYTVATATVSHAHYRTLRALCQEGGWTLYRLHEAGAPYLADVLWHRKGFLVGMALAAAFVALACQRVWQVEYKGLPMDHPDMVALQQCLTEAGVAPGAVARNIDTLPLQNLALSQVPDLSFVGIRKRGTRVQVTCVARSQPPDMVPTDAYTDVVASHAGVVEKVTVLSGQAKVAPGDVVLPGQPLIGSEIQSEEFGSRFVHARGQVLARIWLTATAEGPTTTWLRDTGRLKGVTVWQWSGHELQWGRTPRDFEQPRMEEAEVVGHWLNRLGITVKRRVYYEQSAANPVALDRLTDLLEAEAAREALRQLPEGGQLADRQTTWTIDGETLRVKVTLEAVVDIAQETEAPTEGGNEPLD